MIFELFHGETYLGACQSAKRILKYVKGIVNLGHIYVKGENEAEFLGYSNNDFACDEHDRKSTSRQLLFLGDMLITWSSNK